VQFLYLSVFLSALHTSKITATALILTSPIASGD